MTNYMQVLLSWDRYANDRLLNGASKMTVSAESFRLALAGKRIGYLRVLLIDALYGQDHCARDYMRIRHGLPIDPTTREKIAAVLTAVLVFAPFAALVALAFAIAKGEL